MNPNPNPSTLINPESPLVSIIIPTLNEEKLIRQTLSQFTIEIKKKFNAEVIVSDGGSSDGTLEFVRGKADNLITAKPGEKQNISVGRNRGAGNSKGKYLYFINADTRIEDLNHFFKSTLDNIRDEKVAALTCNIRIFPEEEKTSDKIFHSIYNYYVFILNKIGMGMGRGECHITKKELFVKCGGYNESMPAGEDYDLYRRIRKFGKIKFLRDITVYESPRRYRKYGYLKVFWNWTKNSLSVLLRGKALSKEWEPIR